MGVSYPFHRITILIRGSHAPIATDRTRIAVEELDVPKCLPACLVLTELGIGESLNGTRLSEKLVPANRERSGHLLGIV